MIKPDPDSCHLLLDSRLANEEVQKNPYTYNNIREVLSDGALNGATCGTPGDGLHCSRHLLAGGSAVGGGDRKGGSEGSLPLPDAR